MRINENDYVVVFNLPNDKFFKSYFSDIQIFLNYNDLVAVFEEQCCIALGDSTYRIQWDEYMNLVQGCDIEEMKYSEYKAKYKENLLRYNPDAPVILTINENSSPQSEARILNVAGANILLQRY